MKKFQVITLSILSILFLFASCSNDPDDMDDIDQMGDYYFTVKIDGVEFTSVTTPSVSTLADQTGFYNIQGNAANEDKISMTLISPTSTGTIQISDLNPDTAPRFLHSTLVVENAWAAGGTAGVDRGGVGSVTITENTATYMEGTFSFTAGNPFDNSIQEYTEGRFKAKKF